MKRLVPVLFLAILISSCRKSERDFIWEKSYEKGEALFLRTSSDSGFIACGKMDDKPYCIRLNKNRSLIIDFKSENPGLFSSAWFDTSGYIAGGSTSGKMLLMHYSPSGIKLWEKSLDPGFKIDYTSVFYTGNGKLLAIGSANISSSLSGTYGLYFVRFDTTGLVITEKKITETSFVSANKAEIDNAGNIYLALTRKGASDKTKASAAKFNDLFQKLWETDLFNNPGFAAGSLAIKLDGSGNVFVSGKTELPVEGGTLDNSFLVSLTNAGVIGWNGKKKYLESSNSGSSLIFNGAGDLVMLNKNCFIINILSKTDGSDAGRISMLSLCDSYNTDAIGSDIDINYDKNILVAGSRGGSFYLALKSTQ
jgi:hypothetical protein